MFIFSKQNIVIIAFIYFGAPWPPLWLPPPPLSFLWPALHIINITVSGFILFKLIYSQHKNMSHTSGVNQKLVLSTHIPLYCGVGKSNQPYTLLHLYYCCRARTVSVGWGLTFLLYSKCKSKSSHKAMLTADAERLAPREEPDEKVHSFWAR